MNTVRRLDADAIREAARSHWQGILCALGIEVGTGQHRSCPHCGGKDRFRFDDLDERGTYFCNQCGAGDGFSLVMKVRGCSFPEALQLIAGGLDGYTSSKKIRLRPKPQRPPVDPRRIALQFELHADQLKERAHAVLRAAQGHDCVAWNGDDFDAAMNAVGQAHDDLRHARVLFDVADSFREKAYREAHNE